MPVPPLPTLTGILLELRPSGVLHIVLNTPKNLNAFDNFRYQHLIDALEYASRTEQVKAVVLSSTGKYFSSGAALFSAEDAKGPNVSAKEYVDCLIDFPKLLVCVLQGPAYGITVTTLPFFDLIYAAPGVTLTTPFSQLGICLEGCSSVTFPALLGQTLTTRLLYLSDTVPLQDILPSGLIAEVLPAAGIQPAVLEKVERRLEDLSQASIRASKSLVRSPEVRERLHQVNVAEFKELVARRASEDHKQAIERFNERKKAKKAAAAAAAAKL